MSDNPEEFSVKEEVLHSKLDEQEIKRRLAIGLPVTLAFEVHTLQ